MENFEKIGRARVREVKRHGAFVLKILDPEMPMGPIAPDSEAANEIIEAMKPADKKDSEKNGQIQNHQRPNIRRQSFMDGVNNS
ncbi:MAG TPA: hypothetical protein VIK37_00575 [Candidatus Saccharimonadales bacterium]